MPRISNAFGLSSLNTPQGPIAFDARGVAEVTPEQADFLLRLPGYGLLDEPAAPPAPAPAAPAAEPEAAPAAEPEAEPEVAAPDADAPEAPAPAKVARKRRGR
jgi:hypothetical protein